MQVDESVTEKAVDCLRILTTANEANKVALLTSASGLPSLVRLMETSSQQATTLPCTLCNMKTILRPLRCTLCNMKTILRPLPCRLFAKSILIPLSC